MKQIVAWIQGFALAIGGPGLFFIAFLDSSILSLPEINDLLIVLTVAHHKERMIYYATMSTLGSIAGCLLLYFIGLKGGEAFLRKRFQARHLDRGLGLYRRYGLLAVIVPALLPPPAPFKIFVLLAGVAHMRLAHFVVAIAIGRGLRYFGEGWLAVMYGEHAIDYIHENGTTVSLVLAGLVVAGAIAILILRKFGGSGTASSEAD
jgi:membrane protein YqaA with SNARE-associated domain